VHKSLLSSPGEKHALFTLYCFPGQSIALVRPSLAVSEYYMVACDEPQRGYPAAVNNLAFLAPFSAALAGTLVAALSAR